MPGIAGIVSKNAKDNSIVFSKMLESLDHFNYKIDSTSSNNVHFGRVHLNYVSNKNEFERSVDGRFLLTFSGEIFSYKSFETSQIDDDQEFFLRIFVNDGIDCLKSINGHYCAALYDFVEEKLYLISDRMGTRPLYYAHTNNDFVFAPEVKAILKSDISKDIDYAAISDLFSFAHLFGHKTLFKGISQLPEASFLVLGKDSFTIHKYWDLPESGEAYMKMWPDKRAIEQKTDEFIEIFSNAMRRNFTKNNNKILLSLSGGLDSRYVAAYAKSLGVNPLVSFTMGPDNSEDQIYSKLVAEKLGIQHNPFEVKPKNIWADAQRFAYFSDNMAMIYGPIQGFEALESFFGKSQITISSQMCDAIFGGNLWRKKLKILLRKNSFDEEARIIVTDSFKLFDDNHLRQILTKEFYQKLNNKYKEVPQQYINSTNIPIHAYINLLMNEHGRRGTLSGNFMNNLYMETRMPSYDNDVIEFAYKLPLKLREHQYLYRKAFTRLYPDLAKIKRERYHIPINASNTRYNLSILENKVASLIKSSQLSPLINYIPKYNRPTYIDYNGWFKRELYNEMVGVVLDERTLSRGIFNPEGLKQLIQLHQNPRNNHSRLIWQVINIEYFFRNFID